MLGSIARVVAPGETGRHGAVAAGPSVPGTELAEYVGDPGTGKMAGWTTGTGIGCRLGPGIDPFGRGWSCAGRYRLGRRPSRDDSRAIGVMARHAEIVHIFKITVHGCAACIPGPRIVTRAVAQVSQVDQSVRSGCPFIVIGRTGRDRRRGIAGIGFGFVALQMADNAVEAGNGPAENMA